MCTTSGVIARIAVLPSFTLNLSCGAKFIGEFPVNEGVSGRVYLVHRAAYAILCFNYDNSEESGMYMNEWDWKFKNFFFFLK